MTSAEHTVSPASMAELRESLPDLTHQDGSPVRVLVADAEGLEADLLSMGYSLLGWETVVAKDTAAAVQEGTARRPDLALLDAGLPDGGGLEVLARLRAHWAEMPAIVLASPAEAEDRIAALLAGADDVVAKPFAVEEILLRSHHLVRRAGLNASTGEELVVGDLVMNTRTHEVTRGGDLIELTATQFNLLKFLMANVRTVLSKDRILQDVWGYDFGGRANIVELYISYLRKRIDAGREPMIHTVRGAGYVIRPAQG